jgi:hypothetical protein
VFSKHVMLAVSHCGGTNQRSLCTLACCLLPPLPECSAFSRHAAHELCLICHCRECCCCCWGALLLLPVQAELLAAPDTVATAWQQLHYPHITLVVGPGAAAVDSQQLPARVTDAGDAAAYRVVLPEPLLVTGQVLGFS